VLNEKGIVERAGLADAAELLLRSGSPAELVDAIGQMRDRL
jgi:hypothetical protein